jgi:5-methylthioadenosine/S-adenosylhomocysteine deaminase
LTPNSTPSNAPIPVDLLLEPEWLIPIEPAGVTLTEHAVAVRDDRIVAVLPKSEARRRFAPVRVQTLPGQVLLPGFVNLHTHAAMNLLRGYADDLPLMRWLQERIWPAERRHASTDFVEAGTMLACAEMLRGGITCFNDMYFFPDAAARAAQRIGIRAALGLIVIEFPSAYAHDAADYLAKGMAVRESLIDHPLISFCWAPHAPYTVSDQSFERIASLANHSGLPIHLHVHETQAEIDESIRLHGVRPLQRLHRLGVVGPLLIAVHSVHLDSSELDLLAREGAFVAHCPTSNLKLGSGIAPVAQMEARGIPFGLGTDGAASNNRLDMFHEIRLAALLAKGASGDAAVVNAHAILRAATLTGAKALGLEAKIGSLVAGKCADMCSIRLDDWIIGPCYDPASHVVYVAGREHVSNVWVAGKQQLKHGKRLGIPDQSLSEMVKLWHTVITT